MEEIVSTVRTGDTAGFAESAEGSEASPITKC